MQKRWPLFAVMVVLMLGLGVYAFTKKPTRPERLADAGERDTDAPSATVSATAPVKPIADAGPKRPSGPDEWFDAGPSVCRLVFGPRQEALTGPAVLSAEGSTLFVTVQQDGNARTRKEHIDPLRTAKTSGKFSLKGEGAKTSRPACAAAGGLLFCGDHQGAVHRIKEGETSGPEIARGDPGARVVAHVMPGTNDVIVGTLLTRQTSEGRLSEAFLSINGEGQTRISEDSNGATDLVLVPRGKKLVAITMDARRAMSPVHAREAWISSGKIVLGNDAVIYVGGGADQLIYIAGASDAHGQTHAFVPAERDGKFGLATIDVSSPPDIDETFTFAPYPNGVNMAPIAAASGGKVAYVARVIPVTKEVDAVQALELGTVERGAFKSLGSISSNGSVSYVTMTLDPEGAIWLYYTDTAGSWLERRACP